MVNFKNNFYFSSLIMIMKKIICEKIVDIIGMLKVLKYYLNNKRICLVFACLIFTPLYINYLFTNRHFPYCFIESQCLLNSSFNFHVKFKITTFKMFFTFYRKITCAAKFKCWVYLKFIHIFWELLNIGKHCTLQ